MMILGDWLMAVRLRSWGGIALLQSDLSKLTGSVIIVL